MMKLSTLWRVDQTIDDEGRSPIADALLACWPDAGTARFFRSSANFTYRVEGSGATAFLRFADEDERTRAAIEQEMALLRWLDSVGIRVNLPTPSRAGQLVETVETSSGVFHAVLLTALKGEQCEIDELDPTRFGQWGAALGRLHATLAPALRNCGVPTPSGARTSPPAPTTRTSRLPSAGRSGRSSAKSPLF